MDINLIFFLVFFIVFFGFVIFTLVKMMLELKSEKKQLEESILKLKDFYNNASKIKQEKEELQKKYSTGSNADKFSASISVLQNNK